MRWILLLLINLSFIFCPVFGEIALTAPKGWECITDPSQLPQKIVRIYVGLAKSSFAPTINIATEETALLLTDYVNLAKSHHESQQNTKCLNMGKMETKSGTMQLLQIDSITQWGDVRFVQGILIKNNYAYVITATCLHQDFSFYSPQFFKALQTIVID